MSDLRNEDLEQLLRSLDALDEEYAAGDLDDEDYRTLHNDYTVRVADVVRARNQESAADSSTGHSDTSVDDAPSAGSRRTVAIVALALFAVGAGWLLARSAGERGLGDALTGNIDPSARQQVVECQQLGTADGLLLEAIQCFDDILVTDPDNVEALSYRAWFLVLASGSGDEVPEDQRTELLAAAEAYLDQAIDVDPNYPDARAFRAVVADRQGDQVAVCRHIGDLEALEPPPFFLELTDPVADRNSCG